MAADVRAKQTRATSDLTDLKRENHVSYLAAGAAGAGAGLLMGGFNPASALIGGIAGLFSAGGLNADSDKKIDDAVARLTTGDLATKFKNNELSKDQLKATLNIQDDELINAIMELSSTINANTDAQ
jgi:hypothetical protein